MKIMPFIFMCVVLLICITACTLSFQNICVQGHASDLVDENQKADADIKLDATVPAL